MVMEPGGRADKEGNRYEVKCILCKLIRIIGERILGVITEPLGDEESGTDYVIISNDRRKEYIQCKASNGEKNNWSISDLERRGLLRKWKKHLDRDKDLSVSLESPCGANALEALIARAKKTSNNPFEFYLDQVCINMNLKKEYEGFCKAIDLKIDSEDENTKGKEIAKSIAYLKRIKVRHSTWENLENNIEELISEYFITEPDRVLDAFISYIVDGDIHGKEISYTQLVKYCKEKSLDLRYLEGESTEFRKIDELKKEYRHAYQAIQGRLIHRKEYDQCIELLQQDKSLVITGDAGAGKSGCTEAIIDFCDRNEIPCLPIKLDRRMPQGNCLSWGRSMGFYRSFLHVFDQYSQNKNAVIILDQLDALRWTLANAAQAVDVCIELIGVINRFNKERPKKIAIVFVCRKIDLENDRYIKRIFHTEDIDYCVNWEEINIGELDENDIKTVIGGRYEGMSGRMKQMLHNPGNLYIWDQIKDKESINECTTSSRLIEAWVKQILENAPKGDCLDAISTTIHVLASKIEGMGRLYIPKSSIQISQSIYDYLCSSSFLMEDNGKIGFIHQSVSDYFISKNMTRQYYDGKPIVEIIGRKDKQTPTRRYQIQMLFQRILEEDQEGFPSVADYVLESSEIRGYIKHLVYECIGQIENPGIDIYEYICCKLEDNGEEKHWLNHTVYGKPECVKYLLKKGLLTGWYADQRKKEQVFSILRSVAKKLDREGVAFIEERSFRSPEDDKKFADILWMDVNEDSDELFEYRMRLYDRYPEYVQTVFIQLDKMLPQYERRVVRFLELCFNHKEEISRIRISGISEIVEETGDYRINDAEYVLEKLLKYVPKTTYGFLESREWVQSWYANRNVERAIIDLIKKANHSLIKKHPSMLWEFYKPFFGKGYFLYNELILDSFADMPAEYSDRIIRYLCDDFNENIYDRSSGAEDSLAYTKCIVEKHSKSCTYEAISIFEDNLMSYILPKAVDILKARIDDKKERGISTYREYYGKLQYSLLKRIPQDRLSSKGRGLLEVLTRKYKKSESEYYVNNVDFSVVRSPIERKKISCRQWQQIITNPQIADPNYRKREYKNGTEIEHSLEMILGEFRDAVMRNPEEMIQMVLQNKSRIVPGVVNKLFSGVAFSERLCDVKREMIEDLFREYSDDAVGACAGYFCEIIAKRNEAGWSKEVVDNLNRIIAQKDEDSSVSEKKCRASARQIKDRAYVINKGEAARAIHVLISKDADMLDGFRQSIDLLSRDRDMAVKMAVLLPLMSAQTIDRKWAQERMLSILEEDTRYVATEYSMAMLYDLYKGNEERVKQILFKSLDSHEEEVVIPACRCICELYLHYDEFSDIVVGTVELTMDQIKYMLDTAIEYLKNADYRKKAKGIILRYCDKKYKMDSKFSRVFNEKLVDLNMEEDFVNAIMQSGKGTPLIHGFVRSLEKSVCPVKKYADTIQRLYEEAVTDRIDKDLNYFGVTKEIVKLVFMLFDECVASKDRTDQNIAQKCLDVWDDMFEREFGYTGELSKELMER